MSKLVKVVACAALMSAPAAMAGVTGNIGGVSTYMFRGVDQSGTPPAGSGAAIQGGVDYSHSSGLYAGTWGSNVAGGNEVDLYGGFILPAGPLTLDIGAIYYMYSEADEVGTDPDTIEAYLGATFGPVSVKGYFSPDLAGSDESSIYVTASGTFALKDKLTLTPQIGSFSGDGADITFGDSYMDYSLTLTQSLKDDVSVSFAVVATDLDDTSVLGVDDDHKFVLGFKKSFAM